VNFGEKLYLFTDGPEEGAVRMSRFDPATNTWSVGSLLPFAARMPGVAVHGGRLYLLFTESVPYPTPTTYPMWMASMGADGTLTPASPTPFHGTGPTLASFGGKLHVAFTSSDAPGVWGDIRTSSFDGTTWTESETIPTGWSTNVLRGEPALARYAGNAKAGQPSCLHLAVRGMIHVREPQTPDFNVWWTYRCGTGSWAVPVTIPSAESIFPAALAASATRLLVVYSGRDRGVRAQSYSYPVRRWPWFDLSQLEERKAMSTVP
jgi:hypothetical protein